MGVTYEVVARRATITIDEPEKRNPMSVVTMAALARHTREAVQDPEVSVIVYTGAGDQAFSAGGDLSGSFADDPVGLHDARGHLAGLLRAMWRGGKPTVARVNGTALAGGFGLAAACDFTICVDYAKLGTTEVRVGLWPMMISAVLIRVMPRKAALELMLTGRIIDPHEAQRLGVVSHVVDRDHLDEAVDETVARLLELSPSSLMIGKDSFAGVADLDFDTALDRLQGGMTEIALTADATEGIEAFIDKRDPVWRGR